MPRCTSWHAVRCQDVHLGTGGKGWAALRAAWFASRLRANVTSKLESKRWVDLDAEQDLMEDNEVACAESFGDCEHNHVLALEDRNSLTEEWPGRRVFVVKGATCACIFDDSGVPIDEPSDFVSAGKQLLVCDDEAKTFRHDWDAGFYRYNRIADDSSGDEDDDSAKGGANGGANGGGSGTILPDVAAIGKRIKLATWARRPNGIWRQGL